MYEQADVVVIGGGQAGLAAGYHLARKKIAYIILESQAQSAGSWPNYYDRLKLFSPARFSSLPGMKMPGNPARYPHRDEIVQYLLAYKDAFDLSIIANQQVHSVRKEGNQFVVFTAEGKAFRSKAVINATGSFRNPYIPGITGQERFRGITLHSSEYRNPKPFEQKRVVVVGRGNSAVQIAVELADVSDTSLAVLKPVQFTKQRLFGKDAHFWLRVTGFDTFPFWRFGLSAPNPGAVIDLGKYQERLQAERPYQQRMFTAFYEDGVIWPDGSKEKIDAIIWATGYRPGLDHLRSTRALEQDGKPLHTAGVSISEPGLYYVGLQGQRSFASATLRGVGSDAKYVVRQLCKKLQSRN
ncbi:NAD(P)-binding domain-containing protein [Paenibacillus humicola]|uniref:NAD(P)-binding domain-containing protein n=1 Tax=Paenibacillus humicola TaxID=3110540 RepID=UPI00237AEC4A|nr:NAD(P)-binding domain-containing protein [Paenibacillus humicola]